MARALEPSTPKTIQRRSDAVRDAGVDTLRGIACILVVMYHVRGGDPTQGLQLDPDNPWSYLMDSLVYVRMPLFTFLSGAVYAMRPCRRAYWPFVRGKARRLMLPMLVIGTAFALLQTVLGRNDDPWYLWHIYPVGHYWFLASILPVFVVVGLMDYRHLLDRVSHCVGLVAALVVLDAALPVWPNLLGLRMAVYLFPFFIAGVAATRFGWGSTPRWMRISAAGGAAALIVATQLGLQGVVPKVPERHSVIASVLGVLVCLTLLAVRRPVRLLAVLGGFSFTIYTCHVFGTSGARMVLQQVGIDSVSVNMIVGLVAGVATGIAVEMVARRYRIGRLFVLGQRVSRARRARA